MSEPPSTAPPLDVAPTQRNAQTGYKYVGADTTIALSGITLGTSGAAGPTLLTGGQNHGADLTLLPGRRYGLMGRNGCGKTTLLRHLEQHAFEGMNPAIRLLYIDDTTTAPPSPDTTIIKHLMNSHKERVATLRTFLRTLESETHVDLDVLSALADRCRMLSADSSESAAAKILVGLGIGAELHKAPLNTLSGGWRHKVALAAALYVQPDVLLLDEPTNHLDLHGACWLESYLTGRAAPTSVIVSHDHVFLNAVTTDIIVFEELTLKQYKGNFETYHNTRTNELLHHKRMFLAQEKRRRRYEGTIERLAAVAAAKGFAAGAIRSRQQQLKNRLGASLDGTKWKYGMMGPRPEILAPPSEEPFTFELLTDVSDIPESANDKETLLIRLTDVAFGYDTPGKAASEDGEEEPRPTLLHHVNLDVAANARIALLGHNGCGKTTLLRILCGELRPSDGDVLRWDGVRIAYFRQHHISEAADVDISASAWLKQRHPHLGDDAVRNALGGFGLIGCVAEERPLRVLSGGQRVRAILASLMATEPHLLLLDEPTAHLDAETCAALSTALQTFDGAIVFASHDTRLVEEVGIDVYVMDDGCPRTLADMKWHAVDQYREHVKDLVRAAAAPKAPAAAPVKPQAKKAVTAVADSKAPDLTNMRPVTCRFCGGPHWSHGCTEKKATKAGDKAKKPQSPPVVQLPRREVATDGGSSWIPVVSKAERKQIRRNK